MKKLCLVFVSALVLAGCTDAPEDDDAAAVAADEAGEKPGETVVLERSLDPVSVLDSDIQDTEQASVLMSQSLFASSPAVVVAASGDLSAIEEGSDIAAESGIPLLVMNASDPGDQADSTADSKASEDDAAQTASPGAAAVGEVERLEATTVLALGTEVEQMLADSLDIDVVTQADDLPDSDDVEGLSDLAVLLVADDEDADPSQSAALASTATAAGATVLTLPEADVRASAEAIESLSQEQPASVLAVGSDFGSVEQVAAQVEVARTGVQLPGGGQTVFPGRRLVALYGHPGTGGLGVLGEQDVDASITRAQELAAEFDSLTDVPVVPTFEIIVTVAQASAGGDGDYSSETPVEQMRPWVEKAGEQGVYVVLDLQPGRANFLDQAKIYEDLLVMPHVGLALDPEWRLTPTQRPLQQIGQVQAEEVNSVIDWLAELTARENLPQKVLVLHQFQLQMLQDTDQIDTTRDEVAVLIHMDGQGTTGEKDSTWQAVADNSPDGVPLGWKNFYDEDLPMLTPEETMTREPTPFMISYQ